MTKVFEGVKVLTYAEWEQQPAVKEMSDEAGTCDTCYGEGEHECYCGDTHECGACDGTGKNINMREVYEAELRAEISKLHAWQEGKAIRNPSSGLTPRALDKRRLFTATVVLSVPGSPTVKETGGNRQAVK